MRRAVIVAVTAGVSIASSRDVSACVVLEPPGLHGYPHDGATGVPIDVVPIYDWDQAGIRDAASLQRTRFELRSQSARSISLSAAPSVLGGAFELKARTAMSADTTYRLIASLPRDSAGEQPRIVVTFKTGNQRSPEPAPPKGAFLQHFQYSGPRDSCGPVGDGTCLAVPQGLVVLVAYVDQFGQERPAHLSFGPSIIANLSGVDQHTNYRCVRLRTRAANGAVSESIRLCGSEARDIYVLAGSPKFACTSGGMAQDGKLLSRSSVARIEPAVALPLAERLPDGGHYFPDAGGASRPRISRRISRAQGLDGSVRLDATTRATDAGGIQRGKAVLPAKRDRADQAACAVGTKRTSGDGTALLSAALMAAAKLRRCVRRRPTTR